MENEIDVLKDVSAKLASVGIEFMLTGSVAMSYYAQPRMTRDIDIVIALQPQDAAIVSALFSSEYYISAESVAEAIRRRSMFNIIHLGSVIKVDFIVRSNTPFAVEEFARRRELLLPDFQTAIVSREDLILSKLLWAKESKSEMQLRDVRNLLASACDMEYIRKWADLMSVREALESMLNPNE